MLLLDIVIPIPSPHLITVFLLALGLCAWLTREVLRRQGKIGIDQPDEHRKKHGKAISRLGGLPIFITLACGSAYMYLALKPTEREWWPIITTCTMMFTIGFFDDLKPLGARIKLVGQIGVACVLYGFGGSIDFISHPTTHAPIYLGMWGPLITIGWLVAVTNIINLIDGMDGLASGFGLFLCLTLAFVGHFNQMGDIVMISTVMAGALAGFLLFNFPPAKIFLGDGGAYLIGFFVAAVSLSCAHKGYIVSAMLVMVVAMGLPILDTLFAILRRAMRGVPVFRADAEHIHHRLINMGYSKGQALGILYAIAAVLSLIGIYLLTQKGHGTVIVTSALALGAIAIARILGYVKSFRGFRDQLQRAVVRRGDQAYAQAYGQVLEMEADRMESSAEFVELLARSAKRLGFTLNPEHGRSTGSMALSDGSIWNVGRMDIEQSDDQWRARLEALVPGFERGVKRWNSLPGVSIVFGQASTTSETPLPNSSPSSLASDE